VETYHIGSFVIAPLILAHRFTVSSAAAQGLFDPLLAQHSHGTNEIAVSDGALLDVVGAEASLNKLLSFFGASPFADDGGQSWPQVRLICCESFIDEPFFGL
jgi:hypothetical protein